eukprot:6879083-Prymnesium_polylepis.2
MATGKQRNEVETLTQVVHQFRKPWPPSCRRRLCRKPARIRIRGQTVLNGQHIHVACGEGHGQQLSDHRVNAKELVVHRQPVSITSCEGPLTLR